MKVTWLGQAGLLFETNGLKIMVDPYLSDSVKKITPAFYRRVPVDQSLFDIKPDVIILTHNHLDHTDPETLPHFLTENSSVLVLASYNAWQTARTFKGNNNYVSFNRNTEWTEKGVRFKAVYAEHSDDHAIGVVIFAEDKTYYVTGDTLYNEKIFDDLPSKIDYVFLPVNGVGNNMNFIDGARFCTKLNAKAVPMHCGLFDEINLSDFPYENKVVPKFYKEINL
jgi:L-ascorbate metabolism protein UlaG (beta-lactamase superfamily)